VHCGVLYLFEDVGDLRWAIPVTWVEIVHLVGFCCYFLDGKKPLFAGEFLEDCLYLLWLMEVLNSPVEPEALSHHHLAYPDHAAPANIGFGGGLSVVLVLIQPQKLDIFTIGEPESRAVYYSGYFIIRVLLAV